MLVHKPFVRPFAVFIIAVIGGPTHPGSVGAQENNKPPKGFTALFNGKDLNGWTGALTEDPRAVAALPPAERAAHQADLSNGIHDHWHVNIERDELVSDGKDPYLATTREFGDFELWVDWKIGPEGDSGIYLRGVPQVQIWDPNNDKAKPQGADKGSGGLWNNTNNGKFPLVVADMPIGEWNRMYIRMVGPYVLVKLNGKITVDNATMENYYRPELPIFPRGPIYLQTHGNLTTFRNVFIRELPAAEANDVLEGLNGDRAEFVSLFNGRDLAGWNQAEGAFEVVDGLLQSREGAYKPILTADSYENFVVRFEFRLPPGGNNGLAIRAPDSMQNAVDEALEIQILDDTAEEHNGLHEYQYCCSLYGLKPAQRGFLRPVGEWNYQETIVDDNHIVVNLNGYEVLDADLVELLKQPLDGRTHLGAFRHSGHIGFCGHDDPVAFRNIYVRRLPSRKR